VELIVPVQEDSSKVIDGATKLADRGAKVSASALMDRLNLPKASDDQDALVGRTARAAVKPLDPRAEVANAMDPVALSEWLFEFRSALTKDLQPLGKALAGAMQAGDLGAMQAALKKISAGMPDLAGDAESLADVLSRQFAKDFTQD
jgi:phage gp29-like protein